jgi:DNA-directed RNA polymerase specialized sigma24 family protein
MLSDDSAALAHERMTMTTKHHQAMPASARASVQRCSPDADLTARFVREVVPLRERLCRHAFGLTHDHYEAEDLVQETMLKACSAFQSFQPGTNLKAWLLPIMINSHINHCRKARRHPVLDSIGDLTDRQLAQVSTKPRDRSSHAGAAAAVPRGGVLPRCRGVVL